MARFYFMILFLLSAFLATTAKVEAQETSGNLLRNGSFEGGMRYWYSDRDSSERLIVENEGVSGRRTLRLETGGIQSAAFKLVPGRAVTISFCAKADEPTTVGWQCSPASREVAMAHHQTWSMKHHHPVEITTQWKRYNATFTPTAPQDGFWPEPTYVMQFGDGDKPWLLDDVTVSYDERSKDAYIPYRNHSVEVFVDCSDLKGFTAHGNILEGGQKITLTGTVFNPSKEKCSVLLRFALEDYESPERTFAEMQSEKSLDIAPGQSVTKSVTFSLSAKGLVLGSFAAVETNSERTFRDGKIVESREVLDVSKIPLCSLPYPKAAKKPNGNERFGGTVFGPIGGARIQKIGMGWTRWYPHMNWEDHQKAENDPPEKWTWYDDKLRELEAMGISNHVVLYGKPGWAFEEGNPLPKDMRWSSDDQRWDDLSVQCGWDRFIVEAVKRYKGRSVVYEIENEPEFDGWDDFKDQYAKFTIRTARLIKKTDPDARVMVDNVYAIPSGLNRHFLEQGGGKYIDIISWHDYHAGWLSDAVGIGRMKTELEKLGAGHIEIWFNEGWAFTNTIVDEPAVALTGIDSATATNMMAASVAEMTVAGQEKTILFYTCYETHGTSFWDYYIPGTPLWDIYGYPLPLVPAWNALSHHIGLSKPVAFIRPSGANLCVFEDQRNDRGVVVAYVDRDAKDDVVLELPQIPGANYLAEDIMGNPVAWQVRGGDKIAYRYSDEAPKNRAALKLPQTGRPVFLVTTEKTSGKKLAELFEPLDRKHRGFSETTVDGGVRYTLPPVWEGKQDTAEGNPAVSTGRSVWRLDQVFPADPTKAEHYRPLTWDNGWWVAKDDTFGGQPKAEMKDGGIRMEFRARHESTPCEMICGLTFIAPAPGNYRLSAKTSTRLWDPASNAVKLTVLRRGRDGYVELQSFPLNTNGSKQAIELETALETGQELILLPRIDGMFTGGDITITDLVIEQESR